jgi:hypothetical protein
VVDILLVVAVVVYIQLLGMELVVMVVAEMADPMLELQLPEHNPLVVVEEETKVNRVVLVL